MSNLRPTDPRYRRRLKAAQRYAEDNPQNIEARRSVLRLMIGANQATQEGLRQYIRDAKYWNATHPDEHVDVSEQEITEMLARLEESERGMVAQLSGNEG